jgi:hypothetical protein
MKEWDEYAKKMLSDKGFRLYLQLLNLDSVILCGYEREGGIGYRRLVDGMLKKYKSEPESDELRKSIKVLNILYKVGKIDKKRYDKLVIDAGNHLTVKIDKKWVYVNKLNTNQIAMSYLIAFIIDKMMTSKFPNTQESGVNIYNKIEKNMIGGLKELNPEFHNIVNHFFNIEDNCVTLNRIVEPIIIATSKDGEERELKVKTYFIDEEFMIVHEGGNGNFIDINLGMDLIVYKKGIGCKSIQIKSSNFNGNRDYYINMGVDWLVKSNGVNVEIRDMKTYEPITLKTNLF